MKPAEKRALTKEIKQTEEYINDLLEQKERQGDKHFYEFEGRKCERYLLHGEFFFPSTITKYQKELAELKQQRKDADKADIKDLTQGPAEEPQTWVITFDHGVCNDCKMAKCLMMMANCIIVVWLRSAQILSRLMILARLMLVAPKYNIITN